MKVGIAYATPAKQVWMTLEMDEGTTIKDAIEKSGILGQFPDIDLATQKVGVFGKVVPLDSPLEDGIRVEIYRGITADPKTVRRRARPEAAGGGDAEG